MNEQQRIAWNLAAGKAAFLRGDPEPKASDDAAFVYAYRTEAHIRKLEGELAAAKDPDALDLWRQDIERAERSRIAKYVRYVGEGECGFSQLDCDDLAERIGRNLYRSGT